MNYWILGVVALFLLSKTEIVRSMFVGLLVYIFKKVVTGRENEIKSFLNIANLYFNNMTQERKDIVEILYDDTVMEIPFLHNGGKYKLLVPFNRRQIRSTLRPVIEKDGKKTMLKDHCPTLPFLLTTKHLNAESVEFEDSLEFDL